MDIRLEAVSKSYGEKIVLQNFSHRFPDGRACCVLGPSGCGKTTLLRLVAVLEAPDSGTVFGAAGQKISAVFQEDRLFENLTAEKNVMLTAANNFTRADARALLAELGLENDARLPVRGFSGGMRRRMAIARALAADWTLLLLDEPLTGLDGETRARVLEIIARRAAGRSVLCATHDEAAAHALHADILRLSDNHENGMYASSNGSAR